MRGFKAFNSDLTCRGFRYEIGKTYEIDADPIICKRGFHFCKSIAGCYNFYEPQNATRICEVEAIGTIVQDDNYDKLCTNKICIIKEIPLEDIKKIINIGNSSGYFNTGNHNTGNYNAGNYNIGNYNTGDYNNGYRNTGYHNSGNSNNGIYNIGSLNTGDYNRGSCNTGNFNSGFNNAGDFNRGNYNAGDFNSGCNNAGIFCTENDPTIKIFDKESSWTYEDWRLSSAYNILKSCPASNIIWVEEKDMTDLEKKLNPAYKMHNGYNRICIVSREDKQKWWDNLHESDKSKIYDLPNFDAEKFYLCTGIRVDKEK